MMTKEEFTKRVSEEMGTQGVALGISSNELIQITVCLKKAIQIIQFVCDCGKENEDMELVGDCILAGNGIGMVMEKFVNPIVKQAQKAKKAEKEDEDDD
ncbi:MAG: hypothetical protein IKF16_02155 [Lachnospiraceae bacterium]|nr:hypothetical protein [Lachnospiraceae bacterium]